MNVTDTAISCYAHFPKEGPILQTMLPYITPNEDHLLFVYRKYTTFTRYPALKEAWFNLIPDEHSCRKDLCVEMLEFILNMHECKLSMKTNKR